MNRDNFNWVLFNSSIRRERRSFMVFVNLETKEVIQYLKNIENDFAQRQ